MFPRWPGFEEDDEQAGAEAGLDHDNDSSINIPPASRSQKSWAPEELEKMSGKQLGRLKAQGVDVGDIMRRRGMEAKVAERHSKTGRTEAGAPDRFNAMIANDA